MRLLHTLREGRSHQEDLPLGGACSGRAERTMNWASEWRAKGKCFGIRPAWVSIPARPLLPRPPWALRLPSAGRARGYLPGLGVRRAR